MSELWIFTPMTKLWIYVSGPYTKGDPATNTRDALEAGTIILNAGHIPIVPHLSHFWHFLFPRAYEEWMQYDFELIQKCDILLRLPGDSNGADREVRVAAQLGIPVIFSMAQDIDWIHVKGHLDDHRVPPTSGSEPADVRTKLEIASQHLSGTKEQIRG